MAVPRTVLLGLSWKAVLYLLQLFEGKEQSEYDIYSHTMHVAFISATQLSPTQQPSIIFGCTGTKSKDRDITTNTTFVNLENV